MGWHIKIGSKGRRVVKGYYHHVNSAAGLVCGEGEVAAHICSPALGTESCACAATSPFPVAGTDQADSRSKRGICEHPVGPGLD